MSARCIHHHTSMTFTDCTVTVFSDICESVCIVQHWRAVERHLWLYRSWENGGKYKLLIVQVKQYQGSCQRVLRSTAARLPLLPQSQTDAWLNVNRETCVWWRVAIAVRYKSDMTEIELVWMWRYAASWVQLVYSSVTRCPTDIMCWASTTFWSWSQIINNLIKICQSHSCIFTFYKEILYLMLSCHEPCAFKAVLSLGKKVLRESSWT